MTNHHGLRGVSERPSPEQPKEFGVSVPQLVPWKRPNVGRKAMNDEGHPKEGEKSDDEAHDRDT